MSGLGRLLFDVGASTVTLQSDMSRSITMTTQMVNSVNAELARIGTGANFNNVSSGINGLIGDVNNLKSAVAGVFGVGLGTGLAKEVMEYADSWQGVSNRIRTTVSDAQDVDAIQRSILGVAQQTGQAVDTTAKTYQRLDTVLASSGKTQAQAQSESIALTRILNEEIVVSGANTGEATRAVSDLVHGLAGGVLQARQFNPIMRQMPDLALQIAKGLGVSVAQLEEMVHKGLPAQQVLAALEKQGVDIGQRFSALPQTFARAWTQLDNSVEAYIGTASQAGTLSDTVKAGIIGLGNNISTVADIIFLAGAATTAWLGGRTLTAINAMTVGVYQAVTAQGAYTTAAVQSTAAQVANADATLRSVAASADAASQRIADLAVQRQKIALELEAAQATMAATDAELASIGILADREAVLDRYMAQEAAAIALREKDVTLYNAQTAASERLAVAEAEEAGAATRLTAAQGALTAAQVEATSVVGVLGRGVTGLFSFIGGWPTVVLAAALATYTWANNTTDLTSSISALNQEAKQQEDQSLSLADVIRGLVAGEAARKQSLEEMATAQRNVAQAELDSLKAQRDQYLTMENVTGSVGLSTIQWGFYEYKVHDAEAAIHALDEAQAKVNFTAFTAKIAAAVTTMQRMFNLVPMAAPQAPDLTKLIEGIDKETAAEAKRVATFGQGRAATVAWERDQAIATATVGLTGKALEETTLEIFKHYDSLISLAQAEDGEKDAKKANTEALKEARKELSAQQQALKDYGTDLGKLNDLEDQLTSGLGGPYLAALKTYQKQIDLTAKTWADAKAAGTANADLIARLSKVQEDAGDQLDRTNVEIKAQHDLMGMAEQDYTNLLAVQGLVPQQQAAMLDGLKKYDDLMRSHYDFYGKYIQDEKDLKAALDEQLPQYVATKRAVTDLEAAQKLNQEATRDWANVWTQAGSTIGDDIGKVVVEGESLMDDLTNVAKQTVEQIISYFAKLAVINPILNSIFGSSMTAGGGSLLPTMANSAFGSILGNGSGGAVDFSSTASGGTSSSIMSPSSWIMAGKNLWSGFTDGGGVYSGSSIFGSWGSANPGSSAFGAGGSYLGPEAGAPWDVPDYGGSYASGGLDATSGSYTPSALGYGLAIAGGVYAGVNEYNRAGGGIGGIAGGAAYGVGTAYAGIGAGAALSGGLSAGMAAIPVVGWIALAAMLVDMISGGKLFGTAATFNGAQTDLRVGSDSAQYVSWADLKGQHGLFGGSYHETDDIAETQDQINAAAAFYKALKDGTDQFAHYFGTTAATIVGGTFSTVFDKKGNVKSTSSTVNGVTYDGETADQFSERLSAENDIAVLKQIGVDVTGYTNTFIHDADGYSQAVQDVAQAMGMAYDDLKAGVDVGGIGTLQGDFSAIQTYDTDGESQAGTYQRLTSELQDVTNGVGLLTGQKTIADIEAFLATSQHFGESLTQTYQRLEQAAMQYNQFVGQFKPQAKYVDDYEAALANIKATYIANAKQANDLAKAAGLSGASVQDLANIMAATAQQEAAALQQLESSAQSLAFSLGLSTTGSLDEVSSEIARLQQQAGQAASPIAGVGNAMQTMAQQATDAMNLMLGDKSPYNDKYKLQIALQGLYAGTASKDQVLSIGKSLWTTTSSQYQALFNQVMAAPAHGTGSGAGGGGTGAQHQGLSAADSQRLQELLKEQQTLQAAAQLQQYETLAQQIAEIASTKGEDWKQVAGEMNLDIAAFEKGLGMTDDQTNAFIQSAQDAKDSNNQNSADIIYWLKIIAQQGGADINVNVQLPPAGGGHSGHAQPNRGGSPSYGHSRNGQPARTITVVPGP